MHVTTNCVVCGTEFSYTRSRDVAHRQACGPDCANSLRGRKFARSTNFPPAVRGARWIALTKGKFALVDKDLFEALNRHKWAGTQRVAETKIRGVDGVWKRHLMHRMVLGLEDNRLQVDHINGNPLDNRRANLRVATRRQNAMNQAKRVIADGLPTASKYKGVYFDGRYRSHWKAYIQYKKPIYLGAFMHEEDAARAYDKAARHYFGEYAALNFPLKGEQSALREHSPTSVLVK